MALRSGTVGLGLLGMVGFLQWLGPEMASAQEAMCDPGLRPVASSPYAYGPRGDRCEGIYIKQVGGTALWVASLTSAFETYDLASGRSLRVEWPVAPEQGLRIRVRSIRPNLYYGMDSARPPGATSYLWPTGILASLKIAKPDIGAVAWIRRRVGDGTRSVYVPLHITQSPVSARRGGYSLVLQPGVKLGEVYLTLGPADVAGRPIPGALLKDREPQAHGFYPAERPIRIAIPPLQRPGLYYLEVSATMPNGTPLAVPPLLFEVREAGSKLSQD